MLLRLRASVGLVGVSCFDIGLSLVANPIRLFAKLFPGTLSRQSLLHSALLARLKVEG
jgi:hypothetical protein